MQLIDANSKVIAQSDETPRRGQAPTSTWTPGARVVDTLQLPIPSDIPLGVYRLEIALYDPTARQRVAIVDTRGDVIADHVVIENLRMVE